VFNVIESIIIYIRKKDDDMVLIKQKQTEQVVGNTYCKHDCNECSIRHIEEVSKLQKHIAKLKEDIIILNSIINGN